MAEYSRRWYRCNVSINGLFPDGAALFVAINDDDGSVIYGNIAYEQATIDWLTREYKAKPWPVFLVLDDTTPSFGVRSYVPNVPVAVGVAIINDEGPPHGYEAEYHSVRAALRENALVAYGFGHGEDPDDGSTWTGTLGVQPTRPYPVRP
jgi:hypothetical protein